MGRKSKKQKEAEAMGALAAFGLVVALLIAILYFIGAVALVVIAVGIPLWFLLQIPYFAWKKSRVKVTVKTSIADYWLSQEEKDDLKERLENWRSERKVVKGIEQQIEELHQYAEEQGLSQNIDGSYSRRTEEGKAASNQLAKLEARLEEAKDQKKLAWSNYYELADKPRQEWEEDTPLLQERELFRRRFSTALVSLVLWVIGVAFFASDISREYLQWAVDFLNGALEMINKEDPMTVDPVFVAMLYSSVVAFILSKLLKFYHTSANNEFTHPVEQPPRVEPDENIDEYTKTGE